jgi:transcriptional regulator with XRE-family HTH domain
VIHERLRRLREQKGWSLDDLERQTGVRSRILGLIDRGAFGELPSGLYGRSAIRAYAKAVGLQPEQVLNEVAELLPSGEDPLDGLARVRGLPRKPAAARTLESGIAPELKFVQGPSTDTETSHSDSSSVGSRPDVWWRPLAATGIDFGLLGVIDAALLLLTALACGTSVAVAARVAAPAMAILFALIASLYFVLLGGVRNATVGSRLAGVTEPDHRSGALDVHAVFARAFRCAVRESSVLVDWALRGDGKSSNHSSLITDH